MKKGDIIAKRKELPKGSILIRQCPDQSKAEEFMLHIEKHYNFQELPRMTTAVVERDGLCVVLDQDSYLLIQARINWVVDNEVAVEYLDTGGLVILDMTQEENKGWVIIHESPPQYQTSVEHMTDEQLRESIEELRSKRLSTPTKIRVAKVKVPAQTAEDKELSLLLGNKTAEEKLELMKKLGLID